MKYDNDYEIIAEKLVNTLNQSESLKTRLTNIASESLGEAIRKIVDKINYSSDFQSRMENEILILIRTVIKNSIVETLKPITENKEFFEKIIKNQETLEKAFSEIKEKNNTINELRSDLKNMSGNFIYSLFTSNEVFKKLLPENKK